MLIEKLNNEGKNLNNFVTEYSSFLCDLIKYVSFKQISVTKIPSYLEDKVKYAVSFENNIKSFNAIITNLLELKNLIRYDDNSFVTIEAYFIKIVEEVKKSW